MAVDEVNEKLLAPLGHSLDLVVAETFGQEEVSIKQVRKHNDGNFNVRSLTMRLPL